MKDIAPLVMEGECSLTEYEGGFTPPSIDIEGEPLDRALLRWRFGDLASFDRWYSVDSNCEFIGQVRITVELITCDDAPE